MKIAIMADPHVGVPGRLDDIMWSLKKIRQHCISRDIKYIIILGDLLHDREQVRFDDLTELVKFLTDTEFCGIRVIALPGNHDMYLKNSWEINSLKPLTRYLTNYDKITNFTIDNTRFWVIPFINYESEYMKILDAVSKKHRPGDVLLTHVGVRSATLNICFLLKNWSVVDFNDSPFDRIYAGHFHIHQQVGRNVWYPGSPIPFRFDEGDSEHGFIIFDTETRDHEFIDILSCNDAERPPQYRTIDESSIGQIDPQAVGGNIIRVALSKEYTHNQLAEIRDNLCKLGAKDVRWMNLVPKEVKDNMMAAKEAASASDLFQRFIDADIDGTKTLNKTLLLKLNNEITADGDRKYIVSDDYE